MEHPRTRSTPEPEPAPTSGREPDPRPGGDRDGAAVRLPPPLVYLGAVVAGMGLHWGVPLRLGLPASLRWAGAAVLTVLGVLAMAAAVGLFRRTGQDPTPWTATPEILATGIYRLSRNPMYVGMALIQAALGLVLANGWILLALPLVLAVVHYTAVRHEEAYLERKFGERYRAYRRSVRRWL